ncbi:hypothetical protein E1212_28020 [Jiangella ureilytica]|uniref:Uncharacterized protein n=1 Tax=Jiangella ureilytica TaxID=2530374 RepID=A0A4R4RA70_9ACTN|nr:hypothetical protein [Jiangella ureilytica]TDC45936.1 hypothetical protein E1212_28020 [Jiangella ureilytica]
MLDGAVYLEDLTGDEADVRTAGHLGAWQGAGELPDVLWLGGHQWARRRSARTSRTWRWAPEPTCSTTTWPVWTADSSGTRSSWATW